MFFNILSFEESKQGFYIKQEWQKSLVTQIFLSTFQQKCIHCLYIKCSIFITLHSKKYTHMYGQVNLCLLNFSFSVKIANFPAMNGKFSFYPYTLNVKNDNVPSKTNKKKCSFPVEKERENSSSISVIDRQTYYELFGCRRMV